MFRAVTAWCSPVAGARALWQAAGDMLLTRIKRKGPGASGDPRGVGSSLSAANAPLVASMALSAWGLTIFRRRQRPRCGRCCPPGALPFMPEDVSGERVGSMTQLPSGLNAYVAGEGSRAVVVVSDIFGIHTGRHKQICDELSAAGYLVVMPDFFRGAYADEGPNPPWWKGVLGLPKLVGIFNIPWAQVEQDILESVMPYLKKRGVEQTAALGFCWGAWVVMHASTLPGVLTCGLSVHPSVAAMATRFGESEPDLLGQVRCPQLVLASADEPRRWKPGGSSERLLSGVGCRFEVFPEMKHGFMPRGSVSNPAVRRDVDVAMAGIKRFLVEHLGT